MSLICRDRRASHIVPLIKSHIMLKESIGQKIKDLRLRSGLSQDDLADASELSSRTIQRIENGETVPRGDSLKRISKVLNVDVERLYMTDINNGNASALKIDKWVILTINLAAFGYLISPLLGIILPMILWVMYRHKTMDANEVGKRIMKYQAFWCLLLFLTYLYIFSLKYFHLNLPEPENQKLLTIVILSLYILNAFIIVFIIIKSIYINKSNFSLQ